MKAKFFSLAVLAMIVFACSSEETTESQDNNLKIQVESDPQSNGRLNGGGSLACVLQEERLCMINYVFPTTKSPDINYNTHFIHYNTSLSETEVLCIRYDYFQCYLNLVMHENQPSDIHTDAWFVPSGRPDDEVSNTSCNDPRLNQTCGD